MTVSVAAVDLGATSGRVMVGHVGPGELRIAQAARFDNRPLTRADGLHWNYSALRRDVISGLRVAGAATHLASIGIDSWAVDYGLIRDGALVDEPFHYRDRRTQAGVDAVHAHLPFADLYRRNGLQFLPFNTIYQLAVDREAGRLAHADQMLLIPDLLGFELTGEARTEMTNASTTGLLTTGRRWDRDLMARLRLPEHLFAPLQSPGTTLGPLLPRLASMLGFTAPVTAIASHDTASAVVATPMTRLDAAYISCGTWGLVGVETDAPIVTSASEDANFTNEGGADGRNRFLRNVMGLWLLNESLATWRSRGEAPSLPQLLVAAAAVPGPVPVIDVDDARFLPPGDMPARIAGYCAEHDLPAPQRPATIVRCIIESLAQAFAQAVREAAELSGRQVGIVHIVGGGSMNALLCQATADRSGLPVVAGPVEATAVGNVLVQARALGAIRGDLTDLRELVAHCMPLERYEPSSSRPG